MRFRPLLWVSALAILTGSLSVYTYGRGQDQNGRWDSRNDQRDRVREYREDERDRESAWREYLKEKRKAYKEWNRANREEREDFERYWRRERGREDWSWDRGDGRDDYGDYRRDRDYQWDDGRWNRGSAPRDGACFFTDAEFRGDSFCVSVNERGRYVGGRFNDRISSIRVFGRARVIAYEHDDFGGDRKVYSGDVWNLAGSFNDRISSFEVTR